MFMKSKSSYNDGKIICVPPFSRFLALGQVYWSPLCLDEDQVYQSRRVNQERNANKNQTNGLKVTPSDVWPAVQNQKKLGLQQREPRILKYLTDQSL